MKDITLDDEGEGGINLRGTKNICRSKVNSQIQHQALSSREVHYRRDSCFSSWAKPGKGVNIKEVEKILYMYQFYQEIGLKRVVEGSPWSVNRKLIIARMKEREVLRGVKLNTLDVWVQYMI